MHTTKQLCMLTVLWHIGLAIALPYPSYHGTDSAYTKSTIPDLSTRTTPEWLPTLQSRGDARKDSAIRRHSLARSFSAQIHPGSPSGSQSSGSQYSGTKRERSGSPILSSFIPTPGLATSPQSVLPHPPKAAGKRRHIENNHDMNSAGGLSGSPSIIHGSNIVNSNTAAFEDHGIPHHYRQSTHPTGSAKVGIDHSDQNPMPGMGSFSRDMPPPPPRPPLRPPLHITTGYPVDNDHIKGRPVYGYPVVPPHQLFHQHAPGPQKEPGSDLDPYLIRRSDNNDLNDSHSLTRRGSSLSSLSRHGSSKGNTGGNGPMVRGADGPDRAARTATRPSRSLSRPSMGILSMTTPYPTNRLESLIHQAQERPTSNPDGQSDSGVPTADVPQNGRKSRSLSPVKSGHMEKRSAIFPRTPGQPSDHGRKSPPPASPIRSMGPSSQSPNTVPQARPFTWPRMPLAVSHNPGSMSLAPDSVVEEQLRNAALRIIRAPNGLPSVHQPYHPLPNTHLTRRPGTPFVPLSPTSMALRTGPYAPSHSEDSSSEQIPQAQSPRQPQSP